MMRFRVYIIPDDGLMGTILAGSFPTLAEACDDAERLQRQGYRTHIVDLP